MNVVARFRLLVSQLYNKGVLALAAAGAVFILVMMGIIVTSVSGRFLFGRPLPGVIEVSEVLMVGIVFLGLARAQQEKLNVRTELITSHLPNKVQFLLSLLGLLTGLALMIGVTWYGAKEGYGSFLIREERYGIIYFPVWPAKIVVPVGSSLLCLQLIIDLVKEAKELFCSQKGV